MGIIYAIRPDPNRPNRIKVGIGERVEDRLSECRRWNPEAEVLATWNDKALQHEQALLWGLSGRYNQVGTEVFDVAEPSAALAYCDSFLGMLPGSKGRGIKGSGKPYQMTWNEKAKRWFKKTDHKQLSVGCAALAATYPALYQGDTKAGSYLAANQWWADYLSRH